MSPEARRTVEEVMVRDPVVVSPEAPLSEFVEIALRASISGAPVVDGSGRVTGVVSLHDVVRAMEPEAGRALAAGGSGPGPDADGVPAREGRRRVGDRPGATGTPGARTVADVMTGSVFTVRPETPVAEAARILAEAEIHRAPVLGGGRLVGLVTTFDLLRALGADAEG